MFGKLSVREREVGNGFLRKARSSVHKKDLIVMSYIELYSYYSTKVSIYLASYG
jgi:hypothetical protein